MSRRCYCLLSLFGVLVFAFHTLAQNSPELQTPADVVAVTGTIFSEDGRQRLDNAMVNLCDPSGNLIQQGAAGGAGILRFAACGETNTF